MRGARISQKMETFNYNLTTRVMEVLDSPKGKLIQIELLVCLATFLLICLEIFGAYRRCCGHWIFRPILWIAYTMSPFLVVYTLGLMNAAPFKNEFFLIWAAFLVILLGSADSCSAYTLEDNEQWKRNAWQYLFKIVGLVFLLALYVDASSPVSIGWIFLYMIICVKFLERLLSSMLGSRAVRQQNMELTVDRTTSLESNEDDVDLTTMKGYDYFVMRDAKLKAHYLVQQCRRAYCCWNNNDPKNQVDPLKVKKEDITLEKVWRCQGKLLTGDSNHHIKDLCLSFALSRILSSQFSGYTMPPKVYQKSWKLFRKIIEEDGYGYERVLRIIEVELAFVFYKFYTKYPIMLGLMINPWMPLPKLVKLVLTISCFFTVASTLFYYQKPKDNVQIIVLDRLNVDAFLTAIVIFAVLLLEILQLVLIIFSEWGKVAVICDYVKRESWWNKYMESVIKFICDTNLPKQKPWERKLRQYSLLESYDYSPSLWLYNQFTIERKNGQQLSDPTELSTEVKSRVIRSLLDEGSKLGNGKTSLIRNEVSRLYSWACDLETQAEVIMVWHIATSMCGCKKIPVDTTPQSDTSTNFKIATSLSKYLAYLVAFAPRLLPDHPYVTERVFDQLIVDARETLRERSSLEASIDELQKVDSSRGQGETVLKMGARLGKELLVKEPEIVWKVLADFWVGLMIYAAPSGDMVAHVNSLTTGGEFVTQLWALLSHSTIGRDRPDKTPELERSRSCPIP